MITSTIRENLLNIASARVSTKPDEYGEPEDNFKKIADYWSLYLGRDIAALDVAHMMVLLKLARAEAAGTIDTYVDIAGYSACAGEIWYKKEQERANQEWLNTASKEEIDKAKAVVEALNA